MSSCYLLQTHSCCCYFYLISSFPPAFASVYELHHRNVSKGGWLGTLGRRSGIPGRRLGTLGRRLGISGGQRLSSCQHAALQQDMMGNSECPYGTDVVSDPNYSPLWGRDKWDLLLLSSNPHLLNLQEIGLPVMPNPCQSQRNPGKRLRN